MLHSSPFLPLGWGRFKGLARFKGCILLVPCVIYGLKQSKASEEHDEN